MSEEIPAVETIDLSPIIDGTKGSADRFDNLMGRQSDEVKETPVVTEKAEVKETKTVEDKGDIPDFSEKKEDKKVEVSDEDALKEELKQHPAIKGEAAKSFAKIHGEKEAVKREFTAAKAQYEARIKELESKSVSSPEQQKLIDSLNEKLKQQEDELGKVNFAATPKIKRYDQQASQELQAAKSYLDGDEAQQQAVELAAGLSGKKRLQALVDSGMGTETIAAVTVNLSRMDALRNERDNELNAWREKSTMMQRELQQEADQKKQAEKAEDKIVFDRVFERLSKELEGYQHMDGYDKWNKDTDERIATAQRIINGEPSLEEIMEYAIRGVNEPATRKIAQNWEKRYREAANELGKLKAAVPNGGAVKTGAAAVQEGGSVGSRFESTLGSIRQQ